MTGRKMGRMILAKVKEENGADLHLSCIKGEYFMKAEKKGRPSPFE